MRSLRLHDAGIQFSVTSGRPPKGMAMLIEPLKLVQPLAAFNGGVLIQPDLATVVDQNFLPAGVPEQVIDSIVKHGLDVWIYTATDWFVRDVNAPHVAREQWTVKFPPKVTKTFDGLLGQVAKIVGVSDDLEGVAKCEKDVQQAGGSYISAARSQPYYLDVTHPKANKGEVVLAFSKLLNIPAEQIATLGDMPNDVLMFKKSGMSIAMGNAGCKAVSSCQATYVDRDKRRRKDSPKRLKSSCWNVAFRKRVKISGHAKGLKGVSRGESKNNVPPVSSEKGPADYRACSCCGDIVTRPTAY